MQRVKNIDYDEDDVYSEEEEYHEEPSYTDEDRESFTALTPVVRAELQESGLQASDKEIEEALWHYYWHVGKSVAYLKNSRTPRPQQPQQGKKDKEKPKSKFDQAAEESAKKAGEFYNLLPHHCRYTGRDVDCGMVGSRNLDEEVGCYPDVSCQSMLTDVFRRLHDPFSVNSVRLVPRHIVVCHSAWDSGRACPGVRSIPTTTAPRWILETRQASRGATEESCSISSSPCRT